MFYSYLTGTTYPNIKKLFCVAGHVTSDPNQLTLKLIFLLYLHQTEWKKLLAKYLDPHNNGLPVFVLFLGSSESCSLLSDVLRQDSSVKANTWSVSKAATSSQPCLIMSESVDSQMPLIIKESANVTMRKRSMMAMTLQRTWIICSFLRLDEASRWLSDHCLAGNFVIIGRCHWTSCNLTSVLSDKAQKNVPWQLNIKHMEDIAANEADSWRLRNRWRLKSEW